MAPALRSLARPVNRVASVRPGMLPSRIWFSDWLLLLAIFLGSDGGVSTGGVLFRERLVTGRDHHFADGLCRGLQGHIQHGIGTCILLAGFIPEVADVDLGGVAFQAEGEVTLVVSKRGAGSAAFPNGDTGRVYDTISFLQAHAAFHYALLVYRFQCTGALQAHADHFILLAEEEIVVVRQVLQNLIQCPVCRRHGDHTVARGNGPGIEEADLIPGGQCFKYLFHRLLLKTGSLLLPGIYGRRR